MKRNLTLLLLLALLAALVIPVHAQAEYAFVMDEAGLMSEARQQDIEALCTQAALDYDCGIYVVTLEDHTFLDDDIFGASYDYYHDNDLGIGQERNGVLLMLSMAARDYSLFVYGDGAEYAIDSYGQIVLEEAFLPLLGEDDWYGGIEAYAEGAIDMLACAAAGEPVRAGAEGSIMLALLIGFVLALIIVCIMRMGMKNVHAQTDADKYAAGSLNLTLRQDRFTHKTHTRTKIQSNSGSSSTARSGGGGSGRSGKF